MFSFVTFASAQSQPATTTAIKATKKAKAPKAATTAATTTAPAAIHETE